MLQRALYHVEHGDPTPESWSHIAGENPWCAKGLLVSMPILDTKEGLATMDMIPVQSSTIASVGYNTRSKVLRIEFLTGAVYDYRDVPEDTYKSLLEAQSKTQYHKNFISMRFRYRQVS